MSTPNLPLSDTAHQALMDLLGTGRWAGMPNTPGVRVIIRPWPDETVDSLVIVSESLAYGVRMNPAGLPVWQDKGTVVGVIAHLRALPSPEAPNAPRTVIADYKGRSWGRS